MVCRVLKVACGFGLLIALLVPTMAVAQFVDPQMNDGGGQTVYDPTVSPLVNPTPDEFVTPGAVASGPVGVNVQVDVTSDNKSGVLTPFYRFSPTLAVKAHVPLIFNYTRHYFGFDAEGSGLGDISLDAEYTKHMSGSAAELRFQGSVKLPTGDENKMDADPTGGEYPVPLGSGAVDLLARAQYAWSSTERGFLAAALYRLNSSSETVTDFGSSLMTNKVTNANLGVLSLFARQRVSGKWWLNLGVSTLLTGDGKVETTWSDSTPATDGSLDQGGTLVDLFPGVSYQLGAVTPYLGVRIPVVTNYDNEFRDDTRDTAFVFQLSYRPTKLAKALN